MKPFIVLIVATIAAIVILKLVKGKFEFALSARIGMSMMLLFTAIGHFIFTKGMSMMIPDFIPMKLEIIYLTGFLEILFAIGLVIPKFRLFTAWIIIVFFILMLPANIKASMEELNYQKGTFDGHGMIYLWFRIPLQIIFIAWVYFSSIKF